MKSCSVNGVLVVVPIAVITFCCWFFLHVFNQTTTKRDYEASIPVLQFSIARDCSSNEVFKVVSNDTVEKIVKEALTDREEIVEREHEKFRGELGTWLSVFGLLTILVTLIVPICGLLFQQKESDKLQKLIDEQSKSIEEIKAQHAEMKAQQAVMKAQQDEIRKKQDEVTNVAEKVSNDMDSNDANIAENTQTEKQDGLRSLLNYFKSLWGKESVEEKISAGIRLFDDCNKKISDAILDDDYDSLRNCLNVMNNVNAYLGSRNLDGFREVFSRRLQSIRPLKHTNEDVVQALEKGGLSGPITGFYNRSLLLQGGVAG
jgi:hypothetical protein